MVNALGSGLSSDFLNGGTFTCNNCISADATADDFGGAGNLINKPIAGQFQLITGPVDLHLKAGADAVGTGQNLSGTFTDDIDGQIRVAPWDVGADERQASTAPMLVKSGLYTGNGLDNRAIFVGFQPDVVLIKRDQGSASGLDYFPQTRTSAMPGDTTKNMSFAGVATYAGGIKSLDPTGFTLGTNPGVNANTAPFYWIALKAAPGELKVGSYTGDGADNRSITGIGFQPDYVMMLPAGAVDPVHRSSAMPGEMTLGIDSLIYATNAVQALEADGFQVGAAPQANQNGMTYYYVASKAVTGRMGVGQYTGNGTVLNVDTVGFQPEVVMVRKTATSRPFVWKPGATGVNVDYNLFFNDYAGSTLDITQLRPLGFQVTFGLEGAGNDRVNDNGTAYYWVAFGPNVPTPVYYSVGTQAAQLYSGNASATTGTLTLASAASSNVGVGDEIRLGSSRYYITGRTSSTVFTIQDSAANGGTPGAGGITFASQAVTIYRAFNSLTAAEANSSNASHLNTPDLVTGNYQLNWTCYKDGPMNDQFTISGYTTGPNNFIRVYTPVFPGQVGASQRHTGKARTGFRLRPTSAADSDTIIVNDSFVRIEGLEIDGSASTATNGAGGVDIETGAATPVGHYVSHNIIYDTRNFTGIYVNATSASVWDNVCHHCDNPSNPNPNLGALVMDGGAGSTAYFYNNTVYSSKSNGIIARSGTLIATNNVVMSSNTVSPFTFADFAAAGGATLTQSHNVSSDGSANGTGSKTGKTSYATYFVSTVLASEDLHLTADSNALWTGYGADLRNDANLPVTTDIDLGPRDVSTPDIGADEYLATTAVRLASFAAWGFDSAALVEWETGSELDNLGFHLYRGLSLDGPWERLTASLIPGLGSSPEGRHYSYLDAGLRNGATYFYRLEDVDRSGRATSHGPVSATPLAGAGQPGEGGETPGGGDGDGSTETPPTPGWTAHGDPTDVSLRVVERTGSSVTFELRTGGFYSLAQEDGSQRLFVPGFFDLAEPGYPTLPTRRTWTDAVVGLGARVASVTAEELLPFEDLLPATAGAPQAVSMRDGTYQKAFRPVKAAALSRGLYPRAQARVLQTAFQGEVKKAYLELAPLRLDVSRGRLVLARRMLVTVLFDGVVSGETGLGGSIGRRPGPARNAGPERLIARFVSRARGLNAVSWEDLLAATTSGAPDLASSNLMLPTSAMRLSRKGTVVPFHVEPRHDRFCSRIHPLLPLRGHAATPTPTTPSSSSPSPPTEQRMALGSSSRGRSAAPSTQPLASLHAPRSFEKNAVFLPALLEAKDFWLWDYGIALGTTKSYPFSLASVVTTGAPARLTVHLQGGSDMDVDPDHHLRFSINDTPVAETSFDGMKPHSFSVDVPASLLLEGPNTLSIEDLADTGATQSFVYLDRFSLDYPHALAAEAGALEGQALTEGVVQAAGFAPGSVLIDLSGRLPRWMGRSRSALAFAAEEGHSYLAVSPEAFLHPQIRPVEISSLRDTDEPGRLDPHRAPGLPPRRPGTRRSPPGPGPLRHGRRPRGRLRLLRLRRGLPRGHPRLPRLRLPPLDPARSPLRPPPRRGLLRPQGLPHRPDAQGPSPDSSREVLLPLGPLGSPLRLRQR